MRKVLGTLAVVRQVSGRCTFSLGRVISDMDALAVWAGDVDGDGVVDVVGGGSDLRIFGGPSWTMTRSVDGLFLSAFTVGDVDGDAWLEIVGVSERTGVSLVKNGTNVTTVSTRASKTVALMDADNDGDLDIVAGTTSGEIFWYENPGWASENIVLLESTVAMDALGSFLAVGNDDGDVVIYEAPDWTSRKLTTTPFFDLRAVRIGDDVVVTASYLDDTVAFFSLSDGGIIEATEAAHGVVDVVVADYDSDSDMDAVSACLDDAKIRKHSNLGAAFETTVVDTDAVGSRALAAADVDGDTALDVIVALDAGILWYHNEDCVVSPPSGSSKKKKRQRFSIAVVVVFSVVASLAFFAAVTFFTMNDTVRDTVTKSIRRVTSRPGFLNTAANPPADPSTAGDDDPATDDLSKDDRHPHFETDKA